MGSRLDNLAVALADSQDSLAIATKEKAILILFFEKFYLKNEKLKLFFYEIFKFDIF